MMTPQLQEIVNSSYTFNQYQTQVETWKTKYIVSTDSGWVIGFRADQSLLMIKCIDTLASMDISFELVVNDSAIH